MFQQSDNYINKQTQMDYGNIARNVKVLLYLLEVSKQDLDSPKSEDNFNKLTKELKKSLLMNGNINLEKLYKQFNCQIKYRTNTPKHLIEKIILYTEAILEEIQSLLKQKAKDEIAVMIDNISKLISINLG